MSRRAIRCEHGFLEKLCAKPGCKHWDGLRTSREKTMISPRVRVTANRAHRNKYIPFFRSEPK
jgi:hypothetical protein